jgi:hypothetical protein
MVATEIQIQLFNQIRSLLPAHISLSEKIASLLEISIDSSYRRIRGEKELSFEEISRLCIEFNISIDQILNLGEGKVLFSGRFINPEKFRFEDALRQILKQLQRINSFEEKKLIYQNKDISFFFYLMFPDMIAFKYFVWMKSHFQFPEFRNTPFSFNVLTEEQESLIRQIKQTFIKIPSIEIMNPDNILTDLRQIEYYKVTQAFQSAEDLNRIYDGVEKMVAHLELLAQLGRKFLPGEDFEKEGCPHTIYVHDFHYGDNEAVALVGENKMTVLTHSAINVITTNDQKMSEYSWEFMQNIIRKSTLISVTGEKARTRFFNLIRERIHEFKSNKVKSLIH